MTRPRPVLTSAGFTGLIQSIAGIVGWLGYADVANDINGEAQGLVSAGILVITLGGNIIHGLFAQSKVTPVSDPQLPNA